MAAVTMAISKIKRLLLFLNIFFVDRRDIAEILLKATLNTINQTNRSVL
jgi:hypothetical protein